jgi:2-polyprenyl-3-methyl-5-hydroxy-6-metoxy-1,4-benzoquinol methylase
MKIVGGQSEDGIEVGNFFDKYNSKNPIVKKLMQGFAQNLNSLVNITGAKDIHEVGCGEGYWIHEWASRGIKTQGSDFSRIAIDLACENLKSIEQNIDLKVKGIYDLETESDSATLVVCCEVLEHLEQPRNALAVLKEIANPYIILSVPREPIWSMLNMARGKYWSAFGCTPGHIQKWSKNQFISLAKEYFEIIEIRSPLPWTMLLGKKQTAPDNAHKKIN